MHFCVELIRRWRFEMGFLMAKGTGYDLHRARLRWPPLADGNAVHTAAGRWEQRGMPRKDPLSRQWLIKAAGRINEDFDNAFNVAPSLHEAARFKPEPAGDG